MFLKTESVSYLKNEVNPYVSHKHDGLYSLN